jgi:hypothetical protein
MIFSIQRYIEDYFERRNLTDVDQYAIRLANAYGNSPQQATEKKILQAFHRIRTVFYRNNPHLNRNELESTLLRLLRTRFKKKAQMEKFPGGVTTERRMFRRQSRLTVRSIIRSFARAVEARGIDTFWESRKKNKLRKQPEKLGQALFAIFTKGVLGDNGHGFILREVSSGVGFIDIAIVLSKTPHLIEMKLVRSHFSGVSQLQTYMRTENRRIGWLVYFDARPAIKRKRIPVLFTVPSGKVNVIGIDINPDAPSQKSRS